MGRRIAGDKKVVLLHLFINLFGRKIYMEAQFSGNNMTDVTVLLCTCGSEAEGRHLAEVLVESKLAACVNVLPGIHSIYRWEGNVETAREVLLLIKSTADRLNELRDRIT